jgi:hypothetical protein
MWPWPRRRDDAVPGVVSSRLVHDIDGEVDDLLAVDLLRR